MKKLEKIIEKGGFSEEPVFQKLLDGYLSAKENLKSAKENFRQKRDEFVEKSEDKKSEEASLFHLLSAARIADLQKSICQIEVQQARFDLKNWLAANHKPAEKLPTEKKEKQKKSAETAPPKPKKTDRKGKEKSAGDDLKLIEGIGPAIEKILQTAGIHSFTKLAKSEPLALREILQAAGNRYKMHDTTTWPEQARLAAQGEMAALVSWQVQLKSGKLKK